MATTIMQQQEQKDDGWITVSRKKQTPKKVITHFPTVPVQPPVQVQKPDPTVIVFGKARGSKLGKPKVHHCTCAKKDGTRLDDNYICDFCMDQWFPDE
jgi:hypothetical protein